MQCQKFNDRWTFEKVDQDDRLKAFYGDDNKIIVTLPYDAKGHCFSTFYQFILQLFWSCRHCSCR